MALLAAAVLMLVFPSDMGIGGILFVAASHVILKSIFYTRLAVILSWPTVSDRNAVAKFYLDRAAAGILGALALRLLADRFG